MDVRRTTGKHMFRLTGPWLPALQTHQTMGQPVVAKRWWLLGSPLPQWPPALQLHSFSPSTGPYCHWRPRITKEQAVLVLLVSGVWLADPVMSFLWAQQSQLLPGVFPNTLAFCCDGFDFEAHGPPLVHKTPEGGPQKCGKNTSLPCRYICCFWMFTHSLPWRQGSKANGGK